ncbi:MAG: hypothetical protein ACI9UT_002616 [Flavobacteriales bacterium]
MSFALTPALLFQLKHSLFLGAEPHILCLKNILFFNRNETCKLIREYSQIKHSFFE